jgi:hypothetical protein
MHVGIAHAMMIISRRLQWPLRCQESQAGNCVAGWGEAVAHCALRVEQLMHQLGTAMHQNLILTHTLAHDWF